jgi:hypothetical protein
MDEVIMAIKLANPDFIDGRGGLMTRLGEIF